MKKFLFLLALVGCWEYHPIQYTLGTESSFHVVYVNGPDDNIDVLRTRAFEVAKQTCGYSGQEWGLNELTENTSNHHVRLSFYCHH